MSESDPELDIRNRVREMLDLRGRQGYSRQQILDASIQPDGDRLTDNELNTILDGDDFIGMREIDLLTQALMVDHAYLLSGTAWITYLGHTQTMMLHARYGEPDRTTA